MILNQKLDFYWARKRNDRTRRVLSGEPEEREGKRITKLSGDSGAVGFHLKKVRER